MADTDSSTVGFDDFEKDGRYKRLGRNLKSPPVVSIGASDKVQRMSLEMKNGRVVDRSCSISTIYSGMNERTSPHADSFAMQYSPNFGHGSSIIASSRNSAVSRTRRNANCHNSSGRGVVTSSVKNYSVQPSTRCNSESVFKLPAPVTNSRIRKERTTVNRSSTDTALNKGSANRSPGQNHANAEPILCHLIEWTVTLNRDNRLIVKGRTESKDCISSKPILHRLSIKKVESTDGCHYCLKGVISYAEDSELPDYVREKFFNGFPDDWVNVCQVWATYRQEGCPVNYRWPMSIADSDDDLRSVITDVTVTSMARTHPSDKNNEGHIPRHVGHKNDSFTQTDPADILPIVASNTVSPSMLPHTPHNRVRSVEIETADSPRSPLPYSFTTSDINGLYNNCMTICNKLKFASSYGNIGNEFHAREEQSSFGTHIDRSSSAREQNQQSRQYHPAPGHKRDRSRYRAEYDSPMATDRRENWHDYEVANRSAGNTNQCIRAPNDSCLLNMSNESEGDSVGGSVSGDEICSDQLESEVYAGVRKISGQKIISQRRETIPRRRGYAKRKRETRRETWVWNAIGHEPVDRKAPCLQCARCNCSGAAVSSMNNLRGTVSAREDRSGIAVNSNTMQDMENQPPLPAVKVSANVDQKGGYKRSRPSTVRAPFRPLCQFEQQDHGTSDDERFSDDEPRGKTSERDLRVSGYVQNFRPRKKSEDARRTDDRPPRGSQVPNNVCNDDGDGDSGSDRVGAWLSPNRKKPNKSGPSAPPIQEWKRASMVESDRVNRMDQTIQKEKASTMDCEGSPKSRVAEASSWPSPTDKTAIAGDDSMGVPPRKRQLYSKKANREKISSTDRDDAMQEAKLLTAWTPMVAKGPPLDSEFEFGLFFHGNLLNEAGRIIRKDFKTNFVRRRISATLIETVDSELYRLVGKLVDQKRTVPKHLLAYCRNGCPSRIEQFCKMWRDSLIVGNPKDMNVTQKVQDSEQMEALEVSISSRGRKIMPPLSYWTGERIVLKDDNPVYVPGIPKSVSNVLAYENLGGKDKRGSPPLSTSKRQDGGRTPLPPSKRRKISVDVTSRTVRAVDATCSPAYAGAGAFGTRSKVSAASRKSQTGRNIGNLTCSYYEPCSRQTDELTDDQLSHA